MRKFPSFAFDPSSSLSWPRCTVVLSSSSSSSSLQPRKDSLMALAISDVFRPEAEATSFRPSHGNFLENGSDECPEIRPVRFWSRLKFNFHAARPRFGPVNRDDGNVNTARAAGRMDPPRVSGRETAWIILRTTNASLNRSQSRSRPHVPPRVTARHYRFSPIYRLVNTIVYSYIL